MTDIPGGGWVGGSMDEGIAMRVLVVDDTVVFRRLVSKALSSLPDVEVVGTASNGDLALSRLAELNPDVMTLDLEMPGMDGLAVLEAMKATRSRTEVIVLSAHTARSGVNTVQALEKGAFDFLSKPEPNSPDDGLHQLRDSLAPLLRAIDRKQQIRTLLSPERPAPDLPGPSSLKKEPVPSPAAPVAPRATTLSGSAIVLIGVSTGGPAALATLLRTVPATFNAPILIVQHMPPLFTQVLAERLDGHCPLPVVEASDGMIALNGHVYLAPGGRHMKATRGPAGQLVLRLTDDPPENGCRPSVDYLFRSMALHFPGRSVAAVLTGMGKDGAAGLTMLKRGGCISIAQDQASSVVFGMPREAIATGAVDHVLPLDQIAGALVRATEEARR